MEKNVSTEEKILEAARRVFTRKGFAATRTKDIAEESGYNSALINYYFRSKQKLFDMIMVDHLRIFVHSVMEVVNNPQTTLFQKIEILISYYIDMLKKNPDLPVFILGEINAGPKKLFEKLGVNKMKDENLILVKQWNDLAAAKKTPPYNPLHILINVVSMTIFPFAASPILRFRTGMSNEEFNQLMEERKTLIPLWIKGMLRIE